MELWIRSQNRKRLVKANGLLISNIGEVYLENEEMILLGEYTPYERALEVLDEIQKYILLPNTDNSAYVYEMPKD